MVGSKFKTAEKLVRAAGVEPTTFGSGGRRSIQLSYARTMTGGRNDRGGAPRCHPVFVAHTASIISDMFFAALLI